NRTSLVSPESGNAAGIDGSARVYNGLFYRAGLLFLLASAFLFSAWLKPGRISGGKKMILAAVKATGSPFLLARRVDCVL
ncbi:MAG: hypothetical protein WCJ07_10815, partial [Verrucomicrobiota bacterium]